MSKRAWTVVTIGIILFFVVVIPMSVWNALNKNYHEVEAAKAHYGAALDVVPEKIKGVWTLSQQYLDHESNTFKEVTKARNNLLAAMEKFKTAGEEDALVTAHGARDSLAEFSKVAGLAVNVQIEAYPNLRGAETTTSAMRGVEEGVNEIKTALDDWVAAIKVYNQYRGGAIPSIIGGFMSKFPSEIKTYEGERKKLDIDELNPAKESVEEK